MHDLPSAGASRFRFNGFACNKHLSPLGHPEVRQYLGRAAGKGKCHMQIPVQTGPVTVRTGNVGPSQKDPTAP